MYLIYLRLVFCCALLLGCGDNSKFDSATDLPVEQEQEQEQETEQEGEPEESSEQDLVEEVDWKDIPVPADAGPNMKWEFQEISDNFEYEAPADNKGSEFLEKWDDFYHNAWAGPGLTEWKRDRSYVADGELKMWATRKPGSDKINMGCITSKTRVVYPVYIEARAKVMNSTLASDVWLLSADDTQEIDILEAYGADYSESAGKDHSYFSKKVHISHHVFIRDPFQDYQPKDAGSWFEDGTVWNKEFHRFGVYWRDPWHLEYYIDGVLVRTVSGKDIIDPKHFTNTTDPGNTEIDTRTGLNKEMDIIINTEDQTWRSSPASGLQSNTYTPTDNELSNIENNTFRVDWIRIYKPVEK
ncbi:family 16 glycosylhydrolase [Zobellia galactanivorans]|uniref:family 16 glycosylhydrolase n=1 Tax=Zobellia galactanivorans (strain DSM 12802 / CCUG 47099 / CIP 106680 / NCIMB 13871 / Dsij) TaxID=63186 RepID=UPI0026E35C70|nr:family 16 glycosylhydrolase [Zobellia galactanivorans]MDO6809699.1 family 16 glycosylhydrolase [Zobellia galactanivorans]